MPKSLNRQLFDAASIGNSERVLELLDTGAKLTSKTPNRGLEGVSMYYRNLNTDLSPQEAINKGIVFKKDGVCEYPHSPKKRLRKRRYSTS